MKETDKLKIVLWKTVPLSWPIHIYFSKFFVITAETLF
jgi:hypothetical protein